MNSTLNFGIPTVLVFQLEVYYKVDRLLTGLTAQLLDGIQIKHLYISKLMLSINLILILWILNETISIYFKSMLPAERENVTYLNIYVTFYLVLCPYDYPNVDSYISFNLIVLELHKC